MGPCVLLVEDDDLVRGSTERLLERAGHDVLSFTTGDELLETGVPPNAEVILLDMRLPGRNGIEVLRELNRNRIDVPVIVITGHADVPDAVEAMKLGAIDFIEKPFSVEKLVDVVDRASRINVASRPSAEERADAESRIARLTKRQRQVLQGMAGGEASKTIAQRLGISVRTVETYRAQLIDRLGVRNGVEALRLAMIAALARPMSRLDVRH
jgi:two-component system response regulator FixJ